MTMAVLVAHLLGTGPRAFCSQSPYIPVCPRKFQCMLVAPERGSAAPPFSPQIVHVLTCLNPNPA